jgi:8-oxo-dGTP diphosphatase
MILATLLYIKNSKGEYLLLKREKEPNRGMISPPGGKLNTILPESPAMCAVREAFEECGIKSSTEDWKLTGTVTENDFPNIGNILIFIFEYKKILDTLPDKCNEGSFHFIHPSELVNYKIPATDEKVIWKLVLDEKKHPFDAAIDCSNYPELKVIHH